jgi:peptide/nickel transport system permease protein
MPSFFIGSLFILAVFRYQIWRGYGTRLPLPMGGFGWDKHLVLPTLALMARPTVQIAQIVAGLLVDELGKQYIVAARSVGNSWPRILRRNALRNILAAVVLSIAGSVRLLVGELVVVEWLFEWPGLGRLLAWTLIPPAGTALVEWVPLFLSPPVVAAVLMALGGVFLLTDLIAAILVRIFDPRLRTPAASS